VNCPLRVLTGALLLFLSGGCASRYFAWNEPLPVDQEHGFVSTDDADAATHGWPWQTMHSPSDNDRQVRKELSREMNKQGFKDLAPVRLH
jgi:hypothetical protein